MPKSDIDPRQFLLVSSDDVAASGVSLDPATSLGGLDSTSGPTADLVPSDGFFGLQWHLLNTGQTGGVAGIDINITEIWNEYTGAGVRVGVGDNGVQYTHPDLDANYDTGTDYDVRDDDADAAPNVAGDNHGTAVAGTIASEVDGIGSVGVAFDATLIGYRMGFGAAGSLTQVEELLRREGGVFDATPGSDVANNSWSFDTPFSDDFGFSFFAGIEQAIIDGSTQGRGGLGTVYVFSAGNERTVGDDVNHHNIQNSIYTIAVGAIRDNGTVTGFSNPGSALLISAPGDDIVTTDRTGNDGYVSGDYVQIDGTSFSAPIVAGVAALMLEANPNLGVFDVQQILGYSARQIDSGDPGWDFNAASNWNGGGLHFSNDYGFGLVDAHAAVRLSETWTQTQTAGTIATLSGSSAPAIAIPDNDATGVSDGIVIAGDLEIDHVEVAIGQGGFSAAGITHTHIGDLIVTLTSPGGTESVLLDRPGINPDTGIGVGLANDDISFVFSSTQFWGEDSAGTWTLTVSDRASGDIGTLNAWDLTLYGHAEGDDDLYVYTDEFNAMAGLEPGRTTLDDDAGHDVLNAAAATTNANVDLSGAGTSFIAGVTVTLTAGTQIEDAFVGDGDDVVTGNAVANVLSGGHGIDVLSGGAGDDTLDGGGDSDTAIFAGDLFDYSVTYGAGQSTIADLIGGDGFDILRDIEFLQFADQTVALAPNLAPNAVDDAGFATTDDAPLTIAIATLLANDSDPDGDPFSLVSLANPVGGIATIDGTDIDFTPNLGFNGTASFQYRIADGKGGIGTATVEIEVTGGNQEPDAIDDAGFVTAEDIPLDIAAATLLANDTDPDGDPLTVTGVGNAAGGSVVLNGTTVTFTPDANISGPASFDYTISDGNGGGDTATVSLDITPVNDDPDAVDDAGFSTDEDTPVDIDAATLLANDTDVEGDPLTVTGVGNAVGGSVVLNGTTVTFTPTGGFTGPASFDYTISDGNGGTDTATVSLTVDPLGDPGVLLIGDNGKDLLIGGSGDDTLIGHGNNDTLQGEGGDDVLDGGAGNDELLGGAGNDLFLFDGSNLGGDTVDGGAGSDTISGGTGNDVIGLRSVTSIEMIDGGGGSDTIQGSGGNDSFDFTGTTLSGIALIDGGGGRDTIVGSAGDDVIEGGAKNDDLSGGAGNDLFLFNGIGLGSDTVDGGAGSDTIQGGAGDDVIGLISFSSIEAIDSGGGSDTIAGTASKDVFDFSGTTISGTVLIDGDQQNDTITGSAGADFVQGGDGHDVLDGGGGFDTALYRGALAEYTILENGGTVTVEHVAPAGDNDGIDTLTQFEALQFADQTVFLGAPNGPPDAIDDAGFVTAEDTPLDIAVAALLANDTDPEGDPLTVTGVGNAVGGATVLNGTTVTFTPDANVNGPASFDYTISDGAGGSDTATVSLDITPVNDDPDAIEDSGFVTAEDTPLDIDAATLLANDTDPEGDPLTVTGVGNAVGGVVVLNGTTVTFTPDANVNGPASFDYTISDGNGGSDTATVSLDITPVNDDPDAVDDSGFVTAEDTPLDIDAATLLANDTDVEGDPLTVTGVGSAVGGAAVLNGTTVTFTPDANVNGPASFDYTISDGNGGGDTATVSLDIIPVNDDPDAVDDAGFVTAEDTPLDIDAATLLANDTDPEGDPLTLTGVGNAVGGAAVLNGTTVTFTPDANVNGPASFDYTISDGNGGSDTATVSLDITPVNDDPDAVDDTGFDTAEDTPVDIDAAALLANDTDVDGDPLTVTGVGNAVGGAVALNGTTVTFTPTGGFTGPASFDYTISDGAGGGDTATVSLDVTPVNDDPDAVDDSGFVTAEDTPLDIAAAVLLANDTDPEGDPLTVTGVGNAVGGVVVLNGTTVTFTPDANVNGPASFDYTISDGNGGSDTATVSLDITLVNDDPDAVNDVGFVTAEDTPLDIAAAALLANDTDVEGDPLTVTGVGSAVGGAAVLNGTTVTFTPDANVNGPASFDYTISDGNGGGDTATVSLDITPVNDDPDAVDDAGFATAEDTPLDIDAATLLANDTDIDGDPLTVTGVGNAVGGAVALNGTTATFTPTGGFTGPASFEYTISDGNGGADTATVSLTVDPAGEPGVLLIGDNGRDLLIGGSGDDTLIGLGNKDTLQGGDGNDVLDGGAGNDELLGGAGNDLFLFDGTGLGSDTVDGGAGSDTISGGAGNDVIGLRSLTSIETIDGGGGSDTVEGSGGNDSFDFSGTTLSGIALIDGGGGRDTIVGSAGDDVIAGGAKNDDLSGGAGDDLFLFDGSDLGTDTVDGGAGSDTIRGGAGDDVIGLISFSSIEAIDSGGGSDTIAGTASKDVFDFSGTTISGTVLIDGDQQNDTITGSAGADFVQGGDGHDVLDGGGGFDTALYRGALAEYAIVEDGGTVTVEHVAPAGDNDGIDTLTQFEALQFADQTVVLGGGGASLELMGSGGLLSNEDDPLLV